MSRRRSTLIASGLLGLVIVASGCGTESVSPSPTGPAATSHPTPAITDVWEPGSLAFDAAGTLYTTDCVRGHVFAIDASGAVSVFAGNGESSSSGAPPKDGVAATESPIHCPAGIGFDSNGNLLVVDHASNRIRSIAADGIIQTIVGGGPPGTSSNDGDLAGDGGPALEATLQEPVGIAFDAEGNLYFADRDNHAVRRVDLDGLITTVAGTGDPGFSGDGGLATEAQLERPQDVAVDADGNLYIADGVNNRIRMVDVAGIITTFAGSGAGGGPSVDPCRSGPATDATVPNPVEVVIGPSGAVYFSSDDGQVVCRVEGQSIASVAGTGDSGFAGDGGAAVDAEFQLPGGLIFDSDGNLFISDSGNHRIRVVSLDGIITTYAGPRE